jgi:hypothetical protein
MRWQSQLTYVAKNLLFCLRKLLQRLPKSKNLVVVLDLYRWGPDVGHLSG